LDRSLCAAANWFLWVVLTGFMGAGKSTVGRSLAAKTGWDFLDIDHQIEASTGSTLQDDNFFDTLGEQAFRQIGV
jgi:shikimate kinase